MNKSTTSLSFPDVNVWLAVILEDHAHRSVAQAWWRGEDSRIAFIRVTEISVLRLLTTHAAMNGRPLSTDEAWQVYERLFKDDNRTVLMPEPPGVEARFREYTTGSAASPKLWGDAWLLAFAEAAGGTVITFDRALAARGAHCLLPDNTGGT
jgi:toxin-antitoxin system PIN domain toxin